MNTPVTPVDARLQQNNQLERAEEGPDGRIVVGVDGSASSIEALRLAARTAAAFGAPLEAITVWNYPPVFEAYPPADWSPEKDAQDILNAAVEAVFGAERPPWLRTTTRRGPAVRAMIDESDGAQMLVLGSRGRGGFVGLLLGSVSAAAAAHAHCPVLIVRATD